MKKVVLKIDGMTCSACSSGLEKYLNKQEGVKVASVNLIMNNAVIEYDDKKIDLILIFLTSHAEYVYASFEYAPFRYIRKEYRNIAPEFCDILVKIKGLIFKIVFYEKDKFRKVRNMYRGYKDYKKNKKGKYPYTK